VRHGLDLSSLVGQRLVGVYRDDGGLSRHREDQQSDRWSPVHTVALMHEGLRRCAHDARLREQMAGPAIDIEEFDEEGAGAPPPSDRGKKRKPEPSSLTLLYPRGFWRGAAMPGVLWLLLLFVVPFYAIVSMAGGSLDPITGTAVPQWNPANWDRASFHYVFQQLFSTGGIYQIVFLRTLRYVFFAVVLCVLVGYPVAYHVSRLHGRMRGIMLALLVLPFWISYLMRMLAWVGILNEEGMLKRILQAVGLMSTPYPWLEGKSITVILGLVYGYVPFFILPLYASLDRIQNSMLEAAWDLGASSWGTFRRVTLPLSKQGILAGVAIIMLPMFGDFYTAYLLSNGRPETAMIGNEVQRLLLESTFGYAQARGAALVTVLAVFVSILTFYYIVSTAKATREAATR
jgi:ABC-type spermidine/putrescine transport system permease subunit I